MALVDNLVLNLDSDINQSEDYQKIRQQLKDRLPAAVNGDKQAQKDITDLLSAVPPVKFIPVAISIEGLHDVYERGSEGDDIYSLHNNHRASNITADKGIILQATGFDNADPTQVTTTGAPNNILLGSGDYIAKDGDINISTVGTLIMQAGQDSIYDEETKTKKKKSWGGLKKKVTITTTTEDIRSADPVTLVANNITLNAADDIYGYATEFKAPEGNTIIKAGEALRLMAVEEVDNKKVDTKKTSSFIGFKYNKDHSTNTRNVASDLPSTILANFTGTQSGEDTQLQGTEFEYLQGADIKAGVGIKAVDDASIIFETINTTVTEQQTNEFNNVVWQSMSDSGSVTETGELPKFTGPVAPTFEAPGGLIVQVPLTEEQQQNNKNLVNVINKMAEQPGYGYLKDITQRSDVDFSVVRLAEEEWNYEQEGLTPAGAALLSLAVAWAAGPTAAGIAESIGGVGGAAASAGFTSITTQAAITLANNKGNIAKTLDDLASSETVRATLTATLTAGALEYINTTVMPDVFKNLSIEDAKSLQGRLVNGAFEGTTSALVDTAINGGSLSDNLEAALLNSSVNAAHGFAASEIKAFENQYILHKVLHAVAGCVAAEAKRAECEAGAIGAGVGEMVAELLPTPDPNLSPNDYTKALNRQRNLASLLVGTLSAYAGYDPAIAASIADISISNNRQLHKEEQQLAAKLYERARQLGKRISYEDIQNALRIAYYNNGKFNEKPTDNMTVSKGGVKLDEGGYWNEYNGVLTQHLQTVSRDVVAFVILNIDAVGGNLSHYYWDSNNVYYPQAKNGQNSASASVNEYTQRELDLLNSAIKNHGGSFIGSPTAYEQAQNEKTLDALLTTAEVVSLASGAGEIYQVAKNGRILFIAAKDYLAWKSKRATAKEVLGRAVENVDDVGKSAEELRQSGEQLTRLLHQVHLGKDAARNKYAVDEAITGARIENTLGIRLQRVPDRNGAGDWFDTRTGKVFDAASPTPTQFFDKPGEFEKWTNSIQAHFDKQGVDKIVVDIAQRGLNSRQAAKVKRI